MDSRPETEKHIAQVSSNIGDMVASLAMRASEHDASKLVEPERPIFDKYTCKLKDSTYGSPEYNQFLTEMKPAIDHHYAVNRHHPEHWKNGISDMSLIDIFEMLADWKAATLRHANGDILKSIEHSAKRFSISPQLKQVLLNTVKELGW